ncbi:MAG TPA: glycosyltransferase family 4 protein [Anaerolineae bacterium]|nr:glycosyltransferase family 4 protein [Anaerolineae bacterium]
MSYRIAHITATFPPHYTGTANVAARNAIALQQHGYDVAVLTAAVPNAPHHELWHDINVHRLSPLIQYGNAPFLPSLWSHTAPFDLLHLHMPFYGGAEMVLARAWASNIPLVITHHQDVQLSGLIGAISYIHDRTIGRAAMRHAARACFTSLDYGRASQFSPMIAANKIRVGELPNGVDCSQFTPGPPNPSVTQQYPINNKKVMLFVGVLDRAHYFKGIPVLLNALASLQDPNLHLIVVGKGNMKTEYEAMSQQLGIANQVHFAGFVPDEQLIDHYRLADVTILPSTTMGEAFGLVLLESLACGTPVIASDLPGVRTVVAPHQDGLLSPPNDHQTLATTIRSFFNLPPATRTAWGHSGRQKVESTYDWSKIGDQLHHLYASILKNQTVTNIAT